MLLCLFVSVSSAERRVALVIGNGAYDHSTRLKNPANDADDVAASLTEIGFDVIRAKDVGIANFRAVIAKFARKARNSDVSLFYYSGHGMQWDGENMLVPTDATLEDAAIVPFEVIPLFEVMNALSLAGKAKILILDACRDNDSERALKRTLAEKQGTKSTAINRGLTKLEATRGQVVVFATQANQTASDNFDDSSRNSPFTHAFLETIKEPGLEIGRTFRRVAARVDKLTRGAQLPEYSVSLLGDFYFVPPDKENSQPSEADDENADMTFDQWKEQTIASLPSATRPVKMADALTVVSWGGVYSRSQVEAYDKPYLAANPDVTITNLDDSNEAISRLRAMRGSGNIEWDVVDVVASDAETLCDEGLAIKLSPNKHLAPAPDGTPASKDFGPLLHTPCFAPLITYSMTAAYRDDAFEKPPTSICALFDVENFPGKRALEKRPDSTLIWALICDGVDPGKVYETLETDAGIERALSKLDEVREHVIWWEAGAQTPQLLIDGEVVIGSSWNGRFFQIIEEQNHPVSMLWHSQIIDLDGWIIPAGLSPERTARALDYVRFSTGTKRLADQAKYISYSPARSSSLQLIGKHNSLGVEMKKHLPTYPDNLRHALLSNANWWANNRDRVNQRFAAWLSR